MGTWEDGTHGIEYELTLRLERASELSERAKRANDAAQHEIDRVDRLGEIVVAAGVEAGQAVRQRVTGGEEQHRAGDTVRAQRLADVAAVGVREAYVEHEQLGRARRERLDGLAAARRRPRPRPRSRGSPAAS